MKNISLVSYDFNSLYPCAQADKYSTRPGSETAYPLKNLRTMRFVNYLIAVDGVR